MARKNLYMVRALRDDSGRAVSRGDPARLRPGRALRAISGQGRLPKLREVGRSLEDIVPGQAPQPWALGVLHRTGDDLQTEHDRRLLGLLGQDFLQGTGRLGIPAVRPVRLLRHGVIGARRGATAGSCAPLGLSEDRERPTCFAKILLLCFISAFLLSPAERTSRPLQARDE